MEFVKDRCLTMEFVRDFVRSVDFWNGFLRPAKRNASARLKLKYHVIIYVSGLTGPMVP